MSFRLLLTVLVSAKAVVLGSLLCTLFSPGSGSSAFQHVQISGAAELADFCAQSRHEPEEAKMPESATHPSTASESQSINHLYRLENEMFTLRSLLSKCIDAAAFLCNKSDAAGHLQIIALLCKRQLHYATLPADISCPATKRTCTVNHPPALSDPRLPQTATTVPVQRRLSGSGRTHL